MLVFGSMSSRKACMTFVSTYRNKHLEAGVVGMTSLRPCEIPQTTGGAIRSCCSAAIEERRKYDNDSNNSNSKPHLCRLPAVGLCLSLGLAKEAFPLTWDWLDLERTNLLGYGWVWASERPGACLSPCPPPLLAASTGGTRARLGFSFRSAK